MTEGYYWWWLTVRKETQDESYFSQIFNNENKNASFQQVVWKYYPLSMASPEKKLTRKHVKSHFYAIIFLAL